MSDIWEQAKADHKAELAIAESECDLSGDDVRHVRIAHQICRDVAELPDRNSPSDQPEMMLVTHWELERIIVATLKDNPP